MLLSRGQSGGVSNLGIPEESVDELGNQLTVEIVRDIPDLTFGLESWDMTTDVEQLLTRTPGTPANGTEFDFVDAKPIDIISPWTGPYGTYTSVRGIVTPYLILESASYRFGVGQASAQTFSLKGDSVYFVPGTPYYKEMAGAGAGSYAFDFTGIKTVEDGDDVFAYCVTVFYADGTSKRLLHGTDFSDTSAGITITNAALAPVGSTVALAYGSVTTRTIAQGDHPSTLVKPSQIKGKNIDVYLSDGAATPTIARLRNAQSVEANWRVTLDKNEELGSAHYVDQDYDVPEASGNLVVRPQVVQDLFNLVAQVAGVPSNETVNALSSTPLEMEVRISHPRTGAILKTLYTPDAVFQPPPIQGRVKQKIEGTLPWKSQSGVLKVYKGARP